jgi:hypothetical protein
MTPTTDFERNLRYTLQALALPPAEQVRVLSPGCVTCDLYEDYRVAHRYYLAADDLHPTPEQVASLTALAGLLEEVPEEAWICFENTCLHHPGWERVREAAQRALEAFGWPLEAPPEFEEGEPGVWQRPGE